jgi:predicted nucleic acid-binding protein
MIAVDASVFISLLEGERDEKVETLDRLLLEGLAVLAPSTITELYSDPREGAHARNTVSGIDILPTQAGFWERTGLLRAKIRRTGAKAGLGDCLLAQACLDADIPLLTRDRDFAAFARIAGLKLA